MKTESNRGLAMLAARWLVGTTTARVATMLFVAVFTTMLWIPSTVQAQTRDVITFTGAKVGTADADGSFISGAPSTEYPGVYVIDVGDMPAHPQKDDDGEIIPQIITVTLSRPQGASAVRSASIMLKNMVNYDYTTVTFAPGETTKTVELFATIFPSDGYEDDNGNWTEIYTWSGNIPVLYSVSNIYHADVEYELLIINTNRTGADEPRKSSYATQLEVLQDTSGNDYAHYSPDLWGEYMLYRFFLSTDVYIGANSRYIINARSTDHTNLGPDDDDYGLAVSHEVELKPLNAGSVCSEVWCIYRPTEDEYLHSLPLNTLYPEYTERSVDYPILEVGPFEVANTTEDAIRYIFFSRDDLPENSSNSTFPIGIQQDRLIAKISNVKINKTSFKSGETMVITATMDNWPFVKRAQKERFKFAFGVTLDDNQTVEPRRFTFDEQTGKVTYYVTAPTVTSPTTVYVDFGPMVRPFTPGNIGPYNEVLMGSEGWFAVTVSPETATPNPITQMDFASLPADGSVISLKGREGWFGGLIVDSQEFPLDLNISPLDATDYDQITFTVTPSNGATSELSNDDFNSTDAPIFYTGNHSGNVTVTATTPSGLTISRSYLLAIVDDEGDVSVYPKAMNHTNTYLVGTVFPKFQFEMENYGTWPVNDEITVNYTHANGITWTEKYHLSDLPKSHFNRFTNALNGYTAFELPFHFTEEHPDVTDESQIGNTVITAEVLLTMQTIEGSETTLKCLATLVSDLRKPSFDDYTFTDAYYTETRPATFTSTVMYLPRKGFTVGYMLPDINVEQTYSNLSGDPVPDWLTLEEDGEYYYTARIHAQLDLNGEDAYSYLYTMAQRSYIPDEAMERHLTRWCQFHYARAENNIVYRVNGENETGDRTFDNRQGVTTFINKVKNADEGVLWSEHVSWGDSYQSDWMYDESCQMFGERQPNGITILSSNNNIDDIYDEVVDLLNQTKATFEVGDECFGGVELTLKREGEVIQTINIGSRGTKRYSFIPPSDGRTYTIEVYYPAYNVRHTNTFVSGQFANIYALHTRLNDLSYIRGLYKGDAELLFTDGITDRSITFWGGKTMDKSYCKIKGFVYAEDPRNFYIHDIPEQSFIKDSKIRLSFDNALMPIAFNPPIEMKEWYNYGLFGYEKRLYQKFHGSFYKMNWSELNSNNTLISVVNSQGEPVNNATLNYACIDDTQAIQGDAGSTGFDNNLKAYQISTDPGQYAQLIEVVADGYQPMLATMYLWNYDYNSWQNRGKMRRHTIVLQQMGEKLHSLDLETLKRSGNLVDNNMIAELNADNLLMKNQDETLNFSETADYANATKHMKDGKFGKTGWSGTKYAHLTGCLPYQQNTPNLTLTTEDGSLQLQPVKTRLITTQDFTTFSQNYCLFDFDLTDQIAPDATMQPILKDGTQTLASLPSLHNHTIDLTALNEANNIKLDFDGLDLTSVDNDAHDNGVNMKDMNKAFDKFNFQMPPVLPFTVSIERDGDYFSVRAVCEVNFLPSGPVMDALDKLDNLSYFDEQFQACMDAVNTAKPADDDFFDDIPRWPSAFCGIKGFLSGIGYVNPETGKLDINFLDGGLTFEASAKAQANVSFGLGGFGMSVDAKIAMTMALVNRAAAMGDVAALPKIDFVIDNQCRLKVCAWAYGGIDIWIAKAKAGVRGGACFDVKNRTVYSSAGNHQTGAKTTLQAKMEAYAEVRFLFWKAKKSWTILNAKKEYLTPNKPSNPFHPDNPEPIFSFSRQNVTRDYKKLRRKVIADLGSPIISNVNGMAQPTYMMGGESLLFNNLKGASNYNDDCLQVFSHGSKNDLIESGLDAPMYDFAEAHNNNGLEMVAFEQVKETLDGDELEAMAESDQIKTVTEKSEIHVATRKDGGEWQTETVGSYWSNGIACVTPAIAVQDDGKAVVIWQQGVAKFNDNGDRYIDGSLMLSRFDGNYWGEPKEIRRLNRRSVPADYQVSMKDDNILVMMTLQQDVNNTMKQATVVYVTVDSDDKVRERFTQVEGSKPQMVSVNGANLVGFLKVNENGRDIELSTVNMKGEPTGTLTGDLGMKSRMVNDFRLIVDDEGDDLDDVALLWSQSDQETTDNGDGTQTVNIKNRIYVSKLCSNNKELYFSTPVEIATMPDDVSLASMDAYLDGLDMKVAYCVTNEQDGGAVLETPVAFTNAIDHKISFNPYEVTDDQQVPVTLTVANNGYNPINSIDVTMGGQTYTRSVSLMPQETTDLTVYYPVTDSFNGTIDYEVAAEFTTANSNSLKIRRQAATRPHRVAQNGTQANVRQVDIALKMISKRTDADGKTTIIAEVNNASLLPLANNMSVKVGLYATPLATEKAAGTSEVTVSASDLYDANADQKNKVKIVTLTADAPDITQTLFLRTTPMQGGEVLTDVRPANNVLPVNMKGKYLPGDINSDGKVDVSDYIGVANYILGNTPGGFVKSAADVNGDGVIDVSDYIGIANLILTGNVYGNSNQSRIYRNGAIE